MALTINNFVGFETNGLEEASYGLVGTPAIQTSVVRGGTYALYFPNSTPKYRIDPTLFGTDQGAPYAVGFALYIGVLTTRDVLKICNASDEAHLTITVNSSGNVLLKNSAGTTVDTSTETLTASKWEYLTVLFSIGNSATAKIFLESTEICSATSDFESASSAAYSYVELGTNTSLGHYNDDVYMASGCATDGSDLLNLPSVFGLYQSDANTVIPDFPVGGRSDDLDSGTWANAGELGFNDANEAIYSQSPSGGGKATSTGSRAGPGTDIDGTVYGIKFITRLSRGNGGGTTHTFYYGKYEGTTFTGTSSTVALNASKEVWEFGTNSSTYFPSGGATDYLGWGMHTGGAQDFEAGDVGGCVLHEPTSDVVISASARTLAGAGLSATIVPGGVSVTGTVGAGALAGPTATITNETPGIVINCTVGALAGAGPAASVIPGPVTIACPAPATASGAGQTATIVPGPVTISATVGTLAGSGETAAIVAGPVTVVCTVGTLAGAGLAATIIPGAVTVACIVAPLAGAGYSATVSSTFVVQCTVGALSGTTYTATIVPGPVSVQCTVGSLSGAGLTATIVAAGGPQTIVCTVATLAGAGYTAVIDVPITITCNVGTLAGGAYTSIVVPGGVTLSCTPGALSGAGLGATIVTGFIVNCTVGAGSLAGQSAQVIPGAVTVTCVAGTLAGAGYSASIDPGAPSSTIVCQVGTLAGAGVTATIVATTTIVTTQAVLASNAYTTTVLPGGVQVGCQVGTLASQGYSGTLTTAVAIPCSTASALFGSLTSVVIPGDVTVSTTVAIATLNGLSAGVFGATTVKVIHLYSGPREIDMYSSERDVEFDSRSREIELEVPYVKRT